MNLAQVPSVAGALLVFALGVVVAINPDAVERVGVAATTALGRTEVRSVFGGMFMAMGAGGAMRQNRWAILLACPASRFRCFLPRSPGP
jgi:hypothetical protein